MTQNTFFTRSVLALIATALLAALPSASHAQCVQQQAKLLASDRTSGDQFGSSVSISGDVAIAGAPLDDDNGDRSGSAYIFRFDGTTWSQDQKLLAFDGAADDRFGVSVSISGDVAIVGANGDDDNGTNSGSAYIFAFDGSSWVLQRKLVPVDGAAFDQFGISVSISGDVAMIGASGDEGGTGSVYIYRCAGVLWVLRQRLLAFDATAGDQFGRSVSISGDVAIVGAEGDDNATGSAHIFRFNGTTWNQEQKLLASDGAAIDFFGSSVFISGNVAIVGAQGDDDIDQSSGSVYIFQFDDTMWNQEQKFLAFDGAADDRFGFTVSISGDMPIVGAPFADDNGADSGSAYIFTDLLGCVSPANINGDCVIDVQDFFAFLDLFSIGDARADLDGDGTISVLDFFVFVAAFAAGCP